VQDNPAEPDRLDHVRLFAVLGTWMEQDVVEATVKNAFAQGVEAVYLVDNGSTDDTVGRALAAGATLAESFGTDIYEERVRILFMNAAVARISLASGEPHVWWLWLDGDEFPEGPDGLTIAEYVAGLDRRFRLVGSTYYNHFPVDRPAYLRGFHPLDFQPQCVRFVPGQPRYCSQPHWKHPLQRFDRAGPFLGSLQGFHGATVLMGGKVIEPTGGIVTHHFPYREEAATRKRMELLCAGADRNAYNDSIGNSSIKKRFATLDAVYAGRFDLIDSLEAHHPSLGVEPRPWPAPASPHRWYTPADREAARRAWSEGGGDQD